MRRCEIKETFLRWVILEWGEGNLLEQVFMSEIVLLEINEMENRNLYGIYENVKQMMPRCMNDERVVNEL